MDDFRLRVFITAAKTLNFTKCAEQLYISQPAVSKHIGELESRYKVQLFERSGSRLALTEAGRVMLEHAERIADGYRRLQIRDGSFHRPAGRRTEGGSQYDHCPVCSAAGVGPFYGPVSRGEGFARVGQQRAGRGGPRASRYRFGAGRKQRPGIRGSITNRSFPTNWC